MNAEDKRWIDQHTQALEGLAQGGAEVEETRVYFIEPGFLTKFDRDCGEGANLASVYVIDAQNAPAPGLHLAPARRQERNDEAGRGTCAELAVHANTINFLLVPSAQEHVEDGEPVLIFLMYKSVFTHAGLAPYAHRPAFAHALSRFIDVQVIAGG
jgi:hypothetical protein